MEATIDLIKKVACKYYNIPLDKLISKSRKGELIKVKKAIALLASENGYSQESIAKEINCSRSNVSCAIKSAKNIIETQVISLKETEKTYKDETDKIRQNIDKIEKEVEVWKDIPGHEGCYQISRDGRIKSLERVITDRLGKKWLLKSRILKRIENKNGKCFCLSKNSKNIYLYQHTVHELINKLFPNETNQNTQED